MQKVETENKGESTESKGSDITLVVIHDVCNKHPIAWQILRFSSLLHSEAIPEDYLKAYLKQCFPKKKEVELNIDFLNAITYLRHFNLLKASESQPRKQVCYNISKNVQLMVRTHQKQQEQEKQKPKQVGFTSQSRSAFTMMPESYRHMFSSMIDRFPDPAAVLGKEDLAHFEVIIGHFNLDHPNMYEPLLAEAYDKVGRSYRHARDFAKAVDYYTKALFIRREKLAKNPNRILNSLKNLADAYYHLEDKESLVKRIQLGEEILGKQQEMKDEPPLDVAKAKQQLADAYSKLDNAHIEKAFSLCKDGLAIREDELKKHESKEHSLLVADSLNLLGNIGMLFPDKKVEAISYYARAMKIAEEIVGPDQEPTLTYKMNWLEAQVEQKEGILEDLRQSAIPVPAGAAKAITATSPVYAAPKKEQPKAVSQPKAAAVELKYLSKKSS